MPQDKQLHGVSLDAVVEKRRLDQALNAKEFAILSGISYSSARTWFRLPGFPVFRGVVFWQDFVQWRASQTGLQNPPAPGVPQVAPDEVQIAKRPGINLPARAARVLLEAC
ncbi:MAG: hypothetical protein NTZ16_14315 [Verrucomicrobia bacterium]|nr:hypothetical protein [Verrucomicrobiota bacterium]